MKYGHFLKPTDSILFEQHDKSSPFNSTHHIVLYQQNGDRIVTTDSVVTSLTLGLCITNITSRGHRLCDVISPNIHFENRTRLNFLSLTNWITDLRYVSCKAGSLFGHLLQAANSIWIRQVWVCCLFIFRKLFTDKCVQYFSVLLWMNLHKYTDTLCCVEENYVI